MFDPNKRVLLLATVLAAALVTAAAFERSACFLLKCATVERISTVPAISPVQQLWVGMDEAERDGRYDEALALNEAIRSDHADLYLINYRAGRLHFLKQDYAAAVESYRRAANLSPSAINPLLELAACYVRLDQTDQAILAYQSVLALDPMNPAANSRLADLHFQRQNYATADAFYLRLCALHPEDLDVATRYGWSQFRQERISQARAVFQAVLIAAPLHEQALSGLRACDALKTSDAEE
jgi:tetratricopeptide (TPR) repeat protein